MRKYLLCTLFLALCMFGFSACGNKEEVPSTPNAPAATKPAVEKKVITVALDACYKPMEWMEKEEVVGFDADLIKTIAKQMNVEVKLKNVVWSDIFDELYNKKHDIIISSVSINDERKKTMAFSDPYYESMPVILTTKGLKIKTAKDLSNKKVSVQKETTADKLITENVANVKLVKFENVDLALESFAKKEVDAVVLDAPVILDYAKQKANPEYEVVKDESLFAKEQFGIITRKDDQALMADINKALAEIKANGEYQKVYDKYFK